MADKYCTKVFRLPEDPNYRRMFLDGLGHLATAYNAEETAGSTFDEVSWEEHLAAQIKEGKVRSEWDYEQLRTEWESEQ